jgi:cyanophycinase-like exopeptidase
MFFGCAAVIAGCGADAASDAPVTSRNLADVCQRDTYFTRAPAAAASPPRPIQVFAEQHDGRFMHELIPQAGDEWRSSDASGAQLVACAKRIDEGRKVKECVFDRGASVGLYAARYRVTVYETKTREQRKVAEIQATGYGCPTLVFFRGGDDAKLYARIRPEQYVTALRDQVQG